MGYTVNYVTNFPTKHRTLTRSDTVAFDYPTAILVLTAGDVTVADEDGTVVTYPSWPANTFIPVMASKLMLTGTTATSFIGIYGDS